MSIQIDEDEISYPDIYMDIAPQLKTIYFIENDISFHTNIRPLNTEQEEEISLFDISSSFKIFEEKNNFGDENYSSIKKEQEKEKNIIEFEDDFPKSTDFISKNEENNSKIPLFEEKEENFVGLIREKKDIFQVIYPNRDKSFLKRKILPKGRSHDDRLDNIRVRIKRTFFNYALLKKLNENLKRIGSKKYFLKFPQHLVSDVDRKRNQDIFEMTLRKFIENEGLNCNGKKNDYGNYNHNLDVLKDNKVKNSLEFQKIIDNKTIKQLYEEYINSDEFKIKEINRLKFINKENDVYIKNYKEVGQNLIEFFFN